jgi:glycosyltransferase involved in cell wall biosynthesis
MSGMPLRRPPDESQSELENESRRVGNETRRGPPRLVYWNNQPSPYFVRRMNTLHDRGNVAVEAWFSQLRAPDRHWSVYPEQWRFPARVLPSGPRRAARSIQLLRRERPDVFVTLYEDYAFASAGLAAKAARIPVVIHALRTFASWRRRSMMREAAKHALFRIVDAVQVCGPDSRAYAEGYGAAPREIFTIREEIDLPFWTPAADPNEPAGRALLSAHGLTGCVFLYVGRLWRGKGVDSLIDAYAALRAGGVDCSLVLVGIGEEVERLRARTRDLDAVVFAGYLEGEPRYLEGEALRAWYSAADVFVFPTLGDPYGEVVQEAMASGLPVIATTTAGDIADRVVEGETGYLVPPADPPSLARRMRLLAADPALRSRLGAKGRERIQDWSTERWASRFEAMILEVLRS